MAFLFILKTRSPVGPTIGARRGSNQPISWVGEEEAVWREISDNRPAMRLRRNSINVSEYENSSSNADGEKHLHEIVMSTERNWCIHLARRIRKSEVIFKDVGRLDEESAILYLPSG